MADVELSDPTPSPGAPAPESPTVAAPASPRAATGTAAATAASSPAKSAAAASSPAQPAEAHKEDGEATATTPDEPEAPANSDAAVPSTPVADTATEAPAADATTTTAPATTSAKTGVVRRKKKGPAKRPVVGGLAIGFTVEELRQQAEKRRAWLQEDLDEHNAIRARVAQKEEKSSSRALSIMLVVWAAVIAAIFLHVYRTMARGLASMEQPGGQKLPASTLLFNAFKAQLRSGSIEDTQEPYM